MEGFLLAVSLAALAGTPHCIGMCGGFAVAASGGGQVPYHVGRIGTYAVLGAIAGGFGRWMPGPSWLVSAISALLVIGMAASLAGWVPEPSFKLPGLHLLGRFVKGRSGPSASLALGVLNGLLPCGLLYGTLALPVASGDALSGALLMVVFGLWTSGPLALAVRGLRGWTERRGARQVLALVVLISGLAGLAFRA